jgi:hypothetical protein
MVEFSEKQTNKLSTVANIEEEAVWV